MSLIFKYPAPYRWNLRVEATFGVGRGIPSDRLACGAKYTFTTDHVPFASRVVEGLQQTTGKKPPIDIAAGEIMIALELTNCATIARVDEFFARFIATQHPLPHAE